MPLDVLAALGAAATLAAMLFASRLPPGADFVLPRRRGYWLYRAGWGALGTGAGRAACSLLAAAALLVSAAALAYAVLREARRRPRQRAWLVLALAGSGAAAAAALLVSQILDLVQLAWFPYGGMDALEPLAAFSLFFAALGPAARVVVLWTAGRERRAAGWMIGLAALELCALAASYVAGVGQPLERPEARGRTLYVVLTETAGGPGRDLYVLAPDVFQDADPAPALRRAAERPRDARALPALRALYEEEAKRWDVPGLRQALLLGAARGDGLAISVLLAHLTVAAPSAEARAGLAALADERAYRIGPLGAAAIARAYARLGDAASAATWAAEAEGPGGIPEGLLGLKPGGALQPGRIVGHLRAPGRTRVALYAKPHPGAPYLLDPAVLVASAEPDADGRFAFSGLPAGRYYLAVAVSAGGEPERRVEVTGFPGDLVLSAGRPSRELPPIAIGYGAPSEP